MELVVTETIEIVSAAALKRCWKCGEYKEPSAFNKDSYRTDGYSNKCRSCVNTFYQSKWKNSRYQSTGMTGHWSKHGGARMDVWREDLPLIWHCQSCGTRQPKDLTPYIYELQEGDYVRACASCYADGCTRLKVRLQTLSE